MAEYPEDWKVVKLGDNATISRGGSPRPIQDWLTTADDGVNWIKIGDVAPGARYITKTEERIRPDGVQFSRSVCKGDFILSNSMSFGRPYILKIDGCIHDGWLAIQRYEQTFHSDFLYYVLSSQEVEVQYIAMAAGSSVKNLNKDKVHDVLLPLPPLPEQKRIAEVLSTADKLIENVEKRIAKKRAIKQGAMQELLTGKKRLPGFTGEWRTVKFSKIVPDITTGLNPRANFVLNNGGVNYYVTIKDFADGKLDFSGCDRIDDRAQQMIQQRSRLRRGDLLFSSIGRVGDVCVVSEEPSNWNINESVFALHPSNAIESYYLFYMIKGDDFRSQMLGSSTGSTMTGIKLGHLRDLAAYFPESISEQRAIAKILGGMDDEISNLERKLEKLKLMKKGMMQDLLTGKVRLKEAS